METGKELQRRVLDELDWEPSVEASHIGVIVNDEVVTLTGQVSSYPERMAAEQAAKRVIGVKAVANDIEVRPAFAAQLSDTDIAQAVVRALEWDASVPDETIKTRVSKGVVTLEGEARFQFQRQAAENAVRRLKGVMGYTNLIVVRPTLQAADVKQRIEAAFRRSAEIDASRVEVDTANGRVVLRGRVRSWTEREEAENAAWAAPGVSKVDDELKVGES